MEERRKNGLTEVQIEEITDIAADKVLDKITLEIGKGTLRLVLYVFGAACIVLLGWLGAKGYIK